MARHVVAPLSDLPPGTRKLVEVQGRPIALFNIEGDVFALLNRCPHQGGSLCDGILIGLIESTEPGNYSYSRQGEILRCPWHGWEFDVRTGLSRCEPTKIKTRAFDVAVEAGETVTEGPYVAETFEVTIDDDYIVLEV